MEDILKEIARLRPNYQSMSALDQGRRQLLDHFERYAKDEAFRERCLNHGKGNSEGVFMSMWTVYAQPLDFPNHFIARKYEINKDGNYGPTDKVILKNSLAELRDQLEGMGLTPIGRDPNDDAKIVETWL